MSRPGPDSLLTHLQSEEGLALDGAQEGMWIDVIRKMDEVYSDLIRYEVDLERKNGELEDAQRFIKSVLESITDILVVSDTRGVIQEINRALSDLTGLAAHDLVGTPLQTLIRTEDQAPFKDWQQSGNNGECEVRFIGQNGHPSDTVLLHASPRIDHDGKRLGQVFTGRPVGELHRAYEALQDANANLRQAQQQLIQQEKMAGLGRLVAGVAHELNNPISFVYGNMHALVKYRQRLETYLDAIHNGVPHDRREKLREDLRIDRLMADLGPLVEGSMEGASRVGDIVKSLKNLSFPNTGPAQTVDLVQAARTAVQWVTGGAGGVIRIEDNLPDRLLVKGHAGQVQQVLVNLIQNAADALDGTGDPVIRLEVTQSEDAVNLAVADNGPGIAPEDQDKIFEPFFTTKDVGQGTGLGLWISYDIMLSHAGSIDVSMTPGGGVTFTMRLPV